MHCGDKFTIVTCNTKSDKERNTNLIKENNTKKIEFTKSKQTEKNFTEFSHMNKMDKMVEKIKSKNDTTRKKEISKSEEEDSSHDISQEDVGNILLSLLGRVSEFQVENLDPCHKDNSDSCDVHTYLKTKHHSHRIGPDRFILGPNNPISQLGLTIPYGLECTPVTFGKLLLLVEKYSTSFCDDLTISVGLEIEEKEKAVKEESGKDGKDGKNRTWEEKTLTPGTVRGQKNRTISDTLSTTSATETHARGMRRAASLLHEANLNKDKGRDRNETSKNSSFLPKYFSTPSTPPSHTITLSAIAQRDFSKNKIAQKNNFGVSLSDEKKNLAKKLFLSYGPLMDTLKILRYNLSILARQVLIAEIDNCREKVDEIKKKNSLDLSLIFGNENQNKIKISAQCNDQIDNLRTLSSGNEEITTGNLSCN